MPFTLAFGHWKGARVGIFNYGRRGHVDVDSVRYQYGSREDVARLATRRPSPSGTPTFPAEERITDLLSRMTLEEKVDAMANRASVPRLGVVGSPHIEGYHGVAQGGPSNWGQRNPTATTQFPQAYGLGATWDPELVRRVAAQEAHEARYLFQSRKYDRSGLIVRAPNADLARDPRWGRTEEVYGEDPFHVGVLATAFTRGLQGDDPRYWKTAALLKHFLANSNEDGRNSSSSNFDERLWREYYAWPFERAVRDGGSRALMAAYNAVDGTPAHVHPMLRQIVMGEWGVDGILCTDGGGLRLLVSDHKAFPDLPAAAAACIKAGINHFLDRHKEAVTEALARGLVTEADLDAALRGIFRVSLRLGLLDPPERVPYSRIGAPDDPEPWAQPETRALVREVTRKSIVLLKNSAGLLPLDRKKVRSVAVVGPLANTVLLDWYSGTPPYAVSPRQGIERVANPPGPPGSNRIGVTWVGDMSATALEVARGKDAVVVCVGNHPEGNAGWEVVTSPSEGKEAVDRRDIVLQPEQESFVRRLYAVNPNTIVVLIANFPYALPWAAENATTILHVTHASQELGTALGDVLFGDFNPGRQDDADLAEVPRPAPADDGLRHPPRADVHVLRGRAAVPVRPWAELHDLLPRPPRDVRGVGRPRRRADGERRRGQHRRPRRGRGRAALRPLPRLEGRAPAEEARRLRPRHGQGRRDAARRDPAPGPGPRLLGHDAPRLGAREGQGRAPGRQLLGRHGADAAHDDRRRAVGGSPEGRRRHSPAIREAATADAGGPPRRRARRRLGGPSAVEPIPEPQGPLPDPVRRDDFVWPGAGAPLRIGMPIGKRGRPPGRLPGWRRKASHRSQEAVMRTRTTIALVAAGLVLAAIPPLPAEDTPPEVLIRRGAAALTGPDISGKAIMKALGDILDAAVLILPQSEDSEEFRSRVDIAKKTMVERSPLNDKVRQYVGFAYRLASGGKTWKVPEGMTSLYRGKDIMAEARKICQGHIDSALAELKAGRNGQAVLHLLSFVLMVITPVEAIGLLSEPDDDDPAAGLVMSGSPAYGLSIPCMVSQLAKALNQPVLVVSLGYMPKP